MIGAPDHKRAVRLIEETVDAGARTASACQEMGISMRTFQRWTREDEVKLDGRPDADRPPPDNKLTQAERQAVLDTVNSPAYRSLPPSQIVPTLADEGRYIASESTFYRILREGIAGMPLILHSDNGSPMKESSLVSGHQGLEFTGGGLAKSGKR
jgi:hypothetical protein